MVKPGIERDIIFQIPANFQGPTGSLTKFTFHIAACFKDHIEKSRNGNNMLLGFLRLLKYGIVCNIRWGLKKKTANIHETGESK